jgi:AP-3 complex subunit beta
MRGDHALPDWLEQGTERALRDSADDAPAPARAVPTGFGSQSLAPSGRGSPVVLTPVSASPSAGPGTPGARANFKDLDAFYADDDESAESEEDEEGTGLEESEEDEEEDDEEDGTESEGSSLDHAHGASGA